MSLGSYLFNFIGGSARWLWGQVRFQIVGGKKYTFSEYLNGPADGDEIIDAWGHGLINNIVGCIVLLTLIWLLIYLLN